jgi:inosose dehydratase
MVRLSALVDNSARDRVGLAIDFGWVLQAAADPRGVVERFSDRIGYVHLKDAENGRWTELGHGDLAIDTVIDAISGLALPWWTAEQDTTQSEPQLSALENYRFLSSLNQLR